MARIMTDPETVGPMGTSPNLPAFAPPKSSSIVVRNWQNAGYVQLNQVNHYIYLPTSLMDLRWALISSIYDQFFLLLSFLFFVDGVRS